MIASSLTRKSPLQKGATLKQNIHYIRLLWQYWLAKEEREQFASYDGKRAVIKQTPNFFGRSWQILLGGKIVTADSDKIKEIYGSLEVYGK